VPMLQGEVHTLKFDCPNNSIAAMENLMKLIVRLAVSKLHTVVRQICVVGFARSGKVKRQPERAA